MILAMVTLCFRACVHNVIMKMKLTQGGVMFISDGLSPLMELVIWMSYAVTIVIGVLVVSVLFELNKKD